MIGFFVNTLALRVDLDDAPSVSTLLARVKAARARSAVVGVVARSRVRTVMRLHRARPKAMMVTKAMTVMMTPLQRVATIPLLSRLWRTSLQLTPSLSKRSEIRCRAHKRRTIARPSPVPSTRPCLISVTCCA